MRTATAYLQSVPELINRGARNWSDAIQASGSASHFPGGYAKGGNMLDRVAAKAGAPDPFEDLRRREENLR
jgi:hypothetical protein